MAQKPIEMGFLSWLKAINFPSGKIVAVEFTYNASGPLGIEGFAVTLPNVLKDYNNGLPPPGPPASIPTVVPATLLAYTGSPQPTIVNPMSPDMLSRFIVWVIPKPAPGTNIGTALMFLNLQALAKLLPPGAKTYMFKILTSPHGTAVPVPPITPAFFIYSPIVFGGGQITWGGFDIHGNATTFSDTFTGATNPYRVSASNPGGEPSGGSILMESPLIFPSPPGGLGLNPDVSLALAQASADIMNTSGTGFVPWMVQPWIGPGVTPTPAPPCSWTVEVLTFRAQTNITYTPAGVLTFEETIITVVTKTGLVTTTRYPAAKATSDQKVSSQGSSPAAKTITVSVNLSTMVATVSMKNT
jgi:hypothetical protein